MSNSQNHEIVTSISSFIQEINKIIKPGNNSEIKFLFRGQEEEGWPVETSAYRRLKRELKHTEKDELHYNLGLIEQFKHADFHRGNSSKIMELDLGILAQLQHMGAATSLIDFSANPLVALWFACQESSELDSNGKVFILSTSGEPNLEEINSFEQMKKYSVRVPKQVNFPKGNNILNNKKILYWKPAHLNNRITAQQAYFLIGKRIIPGIEEVVIKGNSKKIILEHLSSVHGIERKTLFPDLVGFVQANSVSSSYGKEQRTISDGIIIRHYDEIIEKKPKDPDAYNDRGIIKHNLGYPKSALDDYNKAIYMKPGSAVFLYNRGLVKYSLQDYTGAIDDYNKAIEIKPNNTNIYNNRGYAKNALKDYTGALDDYSKSIEIEPNNASIYNNRGDTKNALKDYNGALDDYNKAIEIYPNSATIYNNSGSTKYKLKYYKNAINDFNKAIEIEPNNAYPYYNRGNAKGALEDYKGAINDYQTSLKYNKDKGLTESINKVIKQAEEKLKELQSKHQGNKE